MSLNTLRNPCAVSVRRRAVSKNAFASLRQATRCVIDVLEGRQLLSAVVQTDLLDYAPGSTAVISAFNDAQGGTNFRVGETVQFRVLHTDGTPNTGGGHRAWRVTDGSLRDLDGKADGRIGTTWYVNPDDSGNSAFMLTATGLSSRAVAQVAFTDAAATAVVTYPANNALLGVGGWTGAITGTAEQPGGPGILKVQLNIKKSLSANSNSYWNGTAWSGTASTYVLATGTTDWSYAIASVPDANYTVSVKVTDTNNVVSPTTTSAFTVDVAVPTLTNFYASSSHYNDPAYSTPPYFTASAADGTTNIVFAEYFIDTQGPDGTGIPFNAFVPAKGVSLNGTLPTAIFDSLAEGQHNIIGRSRDAAGNWSLPSTWSVWYKDLAGPSTSGVTVTPPAANIPPTFTATVSDASSGYHNLTGAEYFIDTAGAPGTGISMNPTGGYFNFANQTPTSYHVTLQVSATLTQAAFDALPSGIHTLFIRGKDVADNWGAVSSVTFSKDVELPLATVTAPGLGSNLSAIPFTLSFSVPVTGLSNSGIAVTNGTIGTLTGSGTTYTVTVIPTAAGAVTVKVLGGAAENQAVAGKFNTVSNTASVVYDIIVPTVTSISSISNYTMSTFYNTVIFTVVFSENVTISGAPQLALNSGGFATYYADNNSTQIRFQYKALAGHAAAPLDFASGNYLSGGTIRDIGGNDAILPTAGAANSWTPRNITVDAVAPTVSITPTGTVTKLSPILFTIRFSENVTGITAASIIVTNGTKGAFTGAGWYYTLSVTPTAQGAVTAKINSGAGSDVANNYSAASNIASVVYDTVAPTTSISLAGTVGAGGAYVDSVVVTLTAADSGLGGIARTEYSLDGTTWSTYAAPFTLSSIGTSTLRFRSVDNAGSTEATKTQLISIIASDTLAPTTTASLAGTVGSNGWYTSNVTVTLAATDAGSGVAQTKYSLDSGTTWLTYTGAFVVSAQGLGSVQYYSTDNNGNVEATQTKSFQIDSIAPTVTGVYVMGSTWNASYLSLLATNFANSSATYGFAVPAGSGSTQLQTLPWRNINRISVAFSEDVSVSQAQLAIGGSVGAYSVSGFSYNAVDHVATWSLLAPIGPDKLYIALPGSTATPVTDAAGLGLDGEWLNPTSYSAVGPTDTFASGNGVAGGDFFFRMDVLPGDSTGGSVGRVNVADVGQTSSRSSKPVTGANYRSDFDGNNVINVADVGFVSSKSSVYSLPASPPTLSPLSFSASLLLTPSNSLLV